uniref:Putative secreted protein n=1 Tax=Anopheles darlingi TaxID=43151 RepID=A0A2M4DL90_ANODA
MLLLLSLLLLVLLLVLVLLLLLLLLLTCRNHRMALHVRLEVRALIERPIADGTLVRGLLQVRHLMDGEGARLAEALTTVGTLERFLLRVDVPVIAQMILPPERLPADITRVRPLIGVRTLVDEQIVGFGKLPITVLADELLLWTGTATTTTTTGTAGSGTLSGV